MAFRSLWTRASRDDVVEAEQRLLEGIPGCETRDVDISGSSAADSDMFIHTIDVPGQALLRDGVGQKPPSKQDPNPLVIWPGFGMGAAGFALTFPYFQTMLPDRMVHAVDWLGFGLSSRPKWRAGGDIDEAESFFVESLEAWRQRSGINKMTLLGHSMGGYLSVAYAEKYPQNIDHLILASPCGIAQRPPQEVLDKRLEDLPFRWRVAFSTFTSIWNFGPSPQSVIRLLGYPLGGHKLVLGYAQGRFAANDQWTETVTKENLGEYVYNVWSLPGSGEYMLTNLLAPLAFARRPLGDRIANLKVEKVSLFYGSTDWMDWKSARLMLEQIASLRAGDREAGRRPKVVQDEVKESENADTLYAKQPHPIQGSTSNYKVASGTLSFVEKSGHQMYLESPRSFVDVVCQLLRAPNLEFVRS